MQAPRQVGVKRSGGEVGRGRLSGRTHGDRHMRGKEAAGNARGCVWRVGGWRRENSTAWEVCLGGGADGQDRKADKHRVAEQQACACRGGRSRQEWSRWRVLCSRRRFAWRVVVVGKDR